MTNSKTISIPEVLWFDELEITPQIDDNAFAALEFSLAAGENATGPSTVLAGAYRLGWPYTELYGHQIPTPIVVVAIDATNGDVYLSNLNIVNSDETEEALLVNVGDDVANQPGPARDALQVGGNFNVDLAALLGLPGDARYYRILLWLDDLVTPVQTVQVPADPSRTGMDPSAYKVSGSNLATVRSSSHSPTAEAGEIRTDLDFSGSSFTAYATMPPGSLDTPPTGGTGDPVLTLLAFCRQTQSFGWWASRDAYTTMVSSKTPNFDFEPFQLLARPDPAANVYVLTIVGNLRNEVLPILVDYQQ